jgi:hypothetical protein
LGEDEDEPPIVNAWFGPEGTISPLHFDPYQNLLAQVVGSKYIKLIHPKFSDRVYPLPGKMFNSSQVHTRSLSLLSSHFFFWVNDSHAHPPHFFFFSLP